jgi:hypothetical protein
MISVRFVAADKKLTQSETKEFQRQLMWMQFYLAIAQIVSEDVPQTAINMVVADEIGDYTFTAGSSIAASVFAAGALLLEIGRRVYVAVKEGAVVARERRVSVHCVGRAHGRRRADEGAGEGAVDVAQPQVVHAVLQGRMARCLCWR